MKRLSALVLVAGCHGAASGEAAQRWVVPLTADAPPGDEVVATVDGRPVRASEIALQARARGTDAKRALDDLITAETLAGEAARRGLDGARDAQDEARAAAVRRLLAQTFESEVTPAAVPAALVHRFFADNYKLLNHDVKIDVWQILVATKGLTPAQRTGARAAAEELAQRARGVADAEAFKALAATVDAPHPASAERVVTARDGWTVHEFSYPAFTYLKKPGDTTPVIETEYGFHVMYLNRFLPPEHATFDEAEPKLRAGLFPDFRKHEFARFADRLAGSHSIAVHPERIPVEKTQ